MSLHTHAVALKGEKRAEKRASGSPEPQLQAVVGDGTGFGSHTRDPTIEAFLQPQNMCVSFPSFFFLSAEDLNAGPRACRVGALPTGPFLQLPRFFFLLTETGRLAVQGQLSLHRESPVQSGPYKTLSQK